MKFAIPLLFLLFCAKNAVGQGFITTWKTDNPGISGTNQITIPTNGTGYSYSIQWESTSNPAINGTITGPITGDHTITFPAAGTYRVSITGSFPRIFLYDEYNDIKPRISDARKILTVEQWGNGVWKSFAYAFAGCVYLTVPATDAPNLTQVTEMVQMFSKAINFNQPIAHWDVSNVTDMEGMFSDAASFNQPIGNWDVGKVTNMQGMFSGAISFNQPIGAWNVSNVTSMTAMFRVARNFNQPIANWDVGKVTNMNRMFFFAENFNQPIGAWNVSNVANMTAMFNSARNFNQPIANWDVGKVANMNEMFSFAENFNQPIGAWNVSKVTTMAEMFNSATDFNQPIGNWDVGNVTDMASMFGSAFSFNQPIGTWNVSKVTDMGSMFSGARNFNQPIGGWNTSNVADIHNMFSYTNSFDQPIAQWNVSKVIDMFGVFNLAINFNQPLDTWNTGGVTNMTNIFSDAKNFNQSLKNWNISNVTSMRFMLDGTAITTANYDETLIGWAAQNVKPNVPLGANGLKYCLGAAARAQLVSKGWVISGDINLVPSNPVMDIVQPLCDGSKGSITIAVQNPTDMYSFDGGQNFQPGNVKSLLNAGTYSVIIKGQSGCSTPPQSVTINEAFTRPPAPIISGSAVVCPNVQAVDYAATNAAYSYQWFVKGGTIQQQQNNKIIVNWGGSNFNASVKALGFDVRNCPTDTVVFPVKIQIQLKPSVPTGFDSVCYNFRVGVPYQTTYTNGSVYTWFANGGVVTTGQSTPNAKIDWGDIGKHTLWVKEENTTSTDYCSGFSDTLKVTVFKDLAAITLNFVSVDYADDKKVQLQWDVSLLERVSDLVIVSRRIAGNNNPWTVVATLDKRVSSFLNDDVATSTNIYEYKVEGFNKCDEGLQTVIHNTIRLQGDKVEEEDLINLAWNDYNGWSEVERYEIWRKLDNEEVYKLIDVTPGDLTEYAGKYGADGFVHHLRVKAKKKGENIISWSNLVELDFENPIDFIPNVITPNGDTKNDFFVIPKLDLYPENSLVVYDRWGQLVYDKKNYDNTWNAEEISAGIYFYLLKVLSPQKNEMKGWLHVIK